MLLNRWKQGIQSKLRTRIHPDGLLITLLYALACLAAREISIDQFNLLAGLRVSALLLCPLKLWPYLLLGEYIHFAQVRYPLIEKYGVAWAIVGSALLMPVAALLVRLHRGAQPPFSCTRLLSLAITASIAAAVVNIGAAQLLWPVPSSLPLPTRAAHQVLGNFIGILAVAPLALLWLQRPRLERIPSIPISVAGLLLLMLVLGLSASRIPSGYAELRPSLQLAMALPAIAMTCLQGWRGAAAAVPLLYLIVGLTTPTSGHPWSFDAATFTVQQILAVAGAALLAMGSTISHSYHRYKMRDVDGKLAVSLTRTSHLAGEMDLRQRAVEINRIGDGIDAYLSETASWLKRQGHQEIAGNLIRTSSLYSRKFREQASMVYPTTLEHVGLYLTLQAGGISEAWANTGHMAEPRLIGDPCRLTIPLQLATYRTLTEAVSLLLQHESGQLRIHARCGRMRGREGIVVLLAVLDPRHRLSVTTRALAIDRLSGRALAYGGTVQCRRNRIRMLFVDVPNDQGTDPGTSTDHSVVSPVR